MLEAESNEISEILNISMSHVRPQTLTTNLIESFDKDYIMLVQRIDIRSRLQAILF